MYMYIYIYIYICMHIYIYMYMYICIYTHCLFCRGFIVCVAWFGATRHAAPPLADSVAHAWWIIYLYINNIYIYIYIHTYTYTCILI